MKTNRRRILAAAGIFLAVAFAAPVHAQDGYPNKPIHMILGFAPGGISDVLGRSLAQRLSSQLGQQVVVENKPGAGGSIAAAYVASAAPDGYTIWLQDMTSHAINATMYSKLTYDSVNAFAPISLVAWTPLMLAVHPSQPTKTVPELIAFLKANPDKYSYGSAGNATPNHLAAEMMLKGAGLSKVVHIPYKGSAPTVQALLSNDVSFAFLSMPPAVANVNNGQLVGLAITSKTRVGAVPNVPTMIEAGLPGFEMVVYTGILAPAGTPRAIIDRLNAEIAKALVSEDVKAVYKNIGAEAITSTPEELRTQMARDIATFAPMIKASGAKID
jgi:tripartite-type tricarboxylate transporter receptor subunit TctC